MVYIKAKKQLLMDYTAVTAGTFLIAVAVCGYMEPCHIITGSVSGLAIALQEVLPLSTACITLLLNVGCLYAGFAFLGSQFGIRSLYVSVLLPALIKVLDILFQYCPVHTGNLSMNITLFLMILTAGQCILFASGTASGGLDTVAEIISAKSGISRGNAIGLCGILTAAVTAAVYGWQTALLGAVITMINGKLVNTVMNINQIMMMVLKRIPAKQ